MLKNQNSVPVLDVDYGIAKKMTRPVEYRLDRVPVFRLKRYSTGRAAKTQSTPSISEIKNSKLEIRNSKQIQMIKKRKIPNNLVLDFDFEI